MEKYIYKCVNKDRHFQCSQYGKEFKAMSAQGARVATGSPIRCNRCSDVARFVKVESCQGEENE